jgi:DNA-binding NtrC family response regulator
MKEKFDDLVDHLAGSGFFLEEVVELVEKRLIERALEKTKGNRSVAAKMLGIHRNTLQHKMADFKIGEQQVKRIPVRKPMRKEVGGRVKLERAASA